MICYVRDASENDKAEDLLVCKSTERQATSKYILKILHEFIIENGLSWNSCVGLCTDGDWKERRITGFV